MYAFSYDGNGVHGVALGFGPPRASAGVQGSSTTGGHGVGVTGDNPSGIGVSGAGGRVGVIGEAANADAPGVQGIHRAGLADEVVHEIGEWLTFDGERPFDPHAHRSR